MINRRQFLINSGALGAWAIAGEMARRIARLAAENDEPYLVQVEKPLVKLWANASDFGYTLTLGCAQADIQEPELTWSELLEGRGVDISKADEVREFLEDKGWYCPEDGELYVPPELDECVPDDVMEHYLESDWPMHDSPEAQAYFYLEGVKLAERAAKGKVGGSLEFTDGAAPGNDSRIVCASEVETLGALQQRLLALGEKVQLRIG